MSNIELNPNYDFNAIKIQNGEPGQQWTSKYSGMMDLLQQQHTVIHQNHVRTDAIEQQADANGWATGGAYPNTFSTLNYYETTYSGGVFTLVDCPSHSELRDGMWFFVKFSQSNTAGDVISISGISPNVELLGMDVSASEVVLSDGDIPAEKVLKVYIENGKAYIDMPKHDPVYDDDDYEENDRFITPNNRAVLADKTVPLKTNPELINITNSSSATQSYSYISATSGVTAIPGVTHITVNISVEIQNLAGSLVLKQNATGYDEKLLTRLRHQSGDNQKLSDNIILTIPISGTFNIDLFVGATYNLSARVIAEHRYEVS